MERVNTNLINLKRRIMGRVFGMWFLRSTVPLLIVELVVLGAAFIFFARLVFVEKVVSNTLLVSFGNPFKMAGYLLDSFFATRPATKFVIIALFAVLVLLLRDINKSIIAYVSMKRSQMFNKI